jgi:hypothetical protein
MNKTNTNTAEKLATVYCADLGPDVLALAVRAMDELEAGEVFTVDMPKAIRIFSTLTAEQIATAQRSTQYRQTVARLAA